MRPFLIAVIFLSIAPGLRGETYREWEEAVPAQAPYVFTKWQTPNASYGQINDQSYSVFEAPPGQLFGHLDFSSIRPAAFPLKVRILYYHIESSAINPTANGSKVGRFPDWTSPIGYLAKDARLGDLIESREMGIKSVDEGHSLPLWGIVPPDYRGEDGGSPLNPYSVLIEVIGTDGTTLIRKCLIEAVSGTSNASIVWMRTNLEAESYLKPLTNRGLFSLDELPVEWQAYNGVRLLWLDDVTLKDSRYGNDFWRRVLLDGTMVLGHNAEVQGLAQRVGISPNQRVLEGGLWSVDDHKSDFFSDLLSATSQQGHYDLALNDKNPFFNSFDFGRKRTDQLRTFSFWFLGSFTAFEIGVIVISLYWLHGRRRVFRWLLIPLSAVLYTALGLIAVNFAVDFRPQAQVFREVRSVEGWPESLVKTEIARLGFENGSASFSTPPQADFSSFMIDLRSSPLESDQRDNETLFSLRQNYGRISTVHVQYWMRDKSPFEVTDNREIVATHHLQGVWVWDGKVWRDLGPMEPGKPVAIEQARILINPSDKAIEGTPGNTRRPWMDQMIMPEIITLMCSSRYMSSLAGTDIGIVLAVDDAPPVDQVKDAAVSEVHNQTILAYQFKLPAAKP